VFTLPAALCGHNFDFKLNISFRERFSMGIQRIKMKFQLIRVLFLGNSDSLSEKLTVLFREVMLSNR
jgi:hypothetical protein